MGAWRSSFLTRSQHLAPAGRSASRWTVTVAHAIPLLLLLQCLWRLPFAFGFEMGLVQEAASPSSAWVRIPYIFALSLTTEALALLGFGLVRRLGEIAPDWMPIIGGWRIPPLAVIFPARASPQACCGARWSSC